MKCFKIIGSRRAVGIFLLMFIATSQSDGQGTVYSYFYRVYLRDKGTNTTSYQSSDILSARAITRRQKAGIPVPDLRDIPVNSDYLGQIKSLGFVLHCTSKWMNTALFKTQVAADVNTLLNLPFVSSVRIVKFPSAKSKFLSKLDFEIDQTGQFPFDRPITMLNGSTLHNSGFNGNTILIAVLDGGFAAVDGIESLSGLRSRNGIITTRDFVNNTGNVYNASAHGTAVMSIMAGEIPGFLAGTATGSDYMLLKTEDVRSEFPCEEDYWAAGAEYADSAGADIISSSLGYYSFDDASLDYKHSDLDGNTAFVTKAADIAASKGILVVNSAGNERDNFWGRIIFPSDGDSVAAIGAVDEHRLISYFSSAGPATDGRIKPDNAAMGVSTPLQLAIGVVTRGNGTSFSCPVISGMAACLMQAVPQALGQDIIDALHLSSDRSNFPDTLYGYGIPDMAVSLQILQSKFVTTPNEEMVAVPNPTKGSFELVFRQAPGRITLEIYSVSGKLIFWNRYPDFAGRSLHINALQHHEQGVYILRVRAEGRTLAGKVIKLKE